MLANGIPLTGPLLNRCWPTTSLSGSNPRRKSVFWMPRVKYILPLC